MSKTGEKRRKRRQNFQPSEISLLFEVVSKHVDVIECKKTDKVNNADKAEAWQEISSSFNAQTTGPCRNLTELKNAWNNKKGQTRKKVAKEKAEIFDTGGGVEDIPKTDKIEECMRVILGPSIDGLYNEYDSDATGPQSSYSILSCTQTEPADDNSATSDSTIVSAIDSSATDEYLQTFESSDNGAPSNPQLLAKSPTWQKWNPAALKLPVSEVLQTAAKGDHKNDNKSTAPSSKLAMSSAISTRKRRPSLHPSSVDSVNKAKQDYLEVQKKIALEQDAREAKLFNIRCEKEQLQKELLELQVKKMREDINDNLLQPDLPTNEVFK